MNVLIVITAALFAAFISYATDKLEGKKWPKAVLIGVVTLVASLSTSLYDTYNKWSNRPRIEARCTMGNRLLVVRLKTDSNVNLQSVRLHFHLPYRILEVRHQNPISDGRSEILVSGGTEVGYLTNRLDIDIYQINPDSFLEFSFFLQDVNGISIDYSGEDVFELSYIWSWEGRNFHESEWRYIKTGARTKEPMASVGVIRFVGDAKEHAITFTVRLRDRSAKVKSEDILKVLHIDDSFSFGKKGVGDFGTRAIPSRQY